MHKKAFKSINYCLCCYAL